MIGKKCIYNRQPRKIKAWMALNGLTMAMFQRELGYKTYTGISNTINGRNHLRRVLRLLVEKGCPVDILDLPMDMREAA